MLPHLLDPVLLLVLCIQLYQYILYSLLLPLYQYNLSYQYNQLDP